MNTPKPGPIPRRVLHSIRLSGGSAFFARGDRFATVCGLPSSAFRNAVGTFGSISISPARRAHPEFQAHFITRRSYQLINDGTVIPWNRIEATTVAKVRRTNAGANSAATPWFSANIR